MPSTHFPKNRGASSNPTGRFETEQREAVTSDWETFEDEETQTPLETFLYPDKAKSIITRNDSPDIGFEQSINPYRGCEHGCIYCYARPSHAYMNLSAGLDFETKIFYKENAAQLLEKEINKPSYKCQTIVIGSNTDPYQPTENKLKVTRGLLEVLNKYNHPTAIITKNSMIERDLDLLTEMAKKQLIAVAVSVTTLSNSLKATLEPRTSTPKARLKTIHSLAAANIPVRVMAAPLIPMINDMELEKILQQAAEAGAKYASYTLIRLPYEVKDLFKEWLHKHFPDRAERVMNWIRNMRGGKEYDSTFGQRMHGQGELAKLLAQRFYLACKRFKLNQTPAANLATEYFKKRNSCNGQLDLFGN